MIDLKKYIININSKINDLISALTNYYTKNEVDSTYFPLTGGVVRGSATFDEIDTMDMTVGNLLVTGAGKIVSGTDYGNSQLRNIFFATAVPANTVGSNGDICIIYTA